LEDVDPEILRPSRSSPFRWRKQIPVNIYELGLIYGHCRRADRGGHRPHDADPGGCPAAQALPQEVEERVRAVPGVTNVKIDLVFDPPWDQSRMSEAASFSWLL